ncbi:hypothetical protein XELAEV_18004947mg [Xenopus laevis]|uniref:Receptor ligand binding region domain-containing protein n=1 Tax=Xenopus laevis TaxID=8355 RepID=A0A974DY77_XENLA|nr:hypothetical protein XELAEV_18004947mg [Xenopus laevis]
MNVFLSFQLTYDATDSTLNVREIFPYIVNTGLDDNIQNIVVVKLVEKLGWTWVIIVATANDSGEKQSLNLQNEIIKHGACVDIIIFITEDTSKNKQKFERIQISTAEVIILCGTPSESIIISLCTLEKVTHEKTLVFLTSWSKESRTCALLYNCSLSFIHTYKASEELDDQFHDYVTSVTDNTTLLKDLLAAYPSCWPQEDINKTYIMNCTEGKTLKDIYLYFLHKNEVYKSVYTIAHALHSMLSVTHKNEYILNNRYRKQVNV